MNKFEIARVKYKPAKIKYLIIAEAPPKTDSNRFFYFELVKNQDSLFLETMKCLYVNETENIDAKIIRSNKKHFLEKFKKDGFYLIDSIDKPFEKKYSSQNKKIFLIAGQKELLKKINSLINIKTKIILISATVYEANYTFLKGSRINVINKGVIYFPGSGGQKQFKEEMKKLLI